MQNISVEPTIAANFRLLKTLQSELRSVNEAMNQNRVKADMLVQQRLRLKNTSCVPHVPFTNTTYNRRWTKRFFVDHEGTEPEPNVDTLRRRKIEQQSFFYHTQPPWTSKETEELLSIVKEHQKAHEQEPAQQHAGSASNNGDDGRGTADDISFQSLDFHVIADIHNRNHETGSVGRRNSLERSSKECEIQYRNENNRNTKKRSFNDAQERTKLEQTVATMLPIYGVSNMNWDKVADEVNATLTSSPNAYRYDAQDCLFAYHSKLKTPSIQLQTTSSVWTRDEDELLFKFIAAAGPQTVIDSKNTLVQSTLCTQLLPHKSKKQIFTRVNHTLLNPNMQRNDWSDYEERRLPICMKVYYTPDPQDGFQLYCASTHCYGRSTKSVVDKWNRSINPAYSTKPFTNEEDEALLKVMRSVLIDRNETGDADNPLQHIGWVELSQTYFPHRHPQRLNSRWSELATDQDIINREKAKQRK